MSYKTLSNAADEIRLATYLARAVYGDEKIASEYRGDSDDNGLDDDYIGYLLDKGLASGGWVVLTDFTLQGKFQSTWQSSAIETLPIYSIGRFTGGGLYPGRIEDGTWAAQGILALGYLPDGSKTLVLAFRGSDDAREAAFLGQAYTGSGQYWHYESFRPLIEAALAYSTDPANQIASVVVAGHSLGGIMADIFSAVDAHRFTSAGLDLTVVSLASAGIDPDLFTDSFDPASFKAKYDPAVVSVSGGQVDLTTPSYYIGIAHNEDRVRYPKGDEDDALGLTPNDSLLENRHFEVNTVALDLPNIDNLDVAYSLNPLTRFGFGAEHNSELYWANIGQLTANELLEAYDGHHIIFGVSDYSRTLDGDGTAIDLFLDYTGRQVYGVDNDEGEGRDLRGTSGKDFILGLAGNDKLYGDADNDLLSGGDGDDLLFGEFHDDVLHGGAGRDFLAGGSGKDVLYGGPDADEFVFSTTPAEGTVDEIKDYNAGTGAYNSAEGDVINVSLMVGTAYAGGNGEKASSLVRTVVDAQTGRVGLQVDPDGAGGGEDWFTIASLNPQPAGAFVDVILNPASTDADARILIKGAAGSWSISPRSATVSESDDELIFTITRPDSTFEQTIYVSTTFNHGHLNDNDYEPWLNETIVFAVGQSQRSLRVGINSSDNEPEVDETFGLIVQSSPDQPANEYLAAATFTIVDDDQSSLATAFTDGDDWVWIDPIPGSATYDGLAGDDRATVNFSGQSQRVLTVGITGGVAFRPDGGGYDVTLRNVENFIVIGGSGNDQLTGQAGDDVLIGNDGNDQLIGNAGNDALSGGAGDDNLSGGDGIDVLSGGAGNDTLADAAGSGGAIDGGSGIDVLNLDRSTSTADEIFTVNTAAAGGASFTTSDGTTITGIETIQLVTGSGNDRVTLVPYVANSQSWDAGAGTDRATVDFSALSQRVLTVDITGGVAFRPDGGGYDVTLRNVENFSVIGGSGNDSLSARGGDDVLVGNGGGDNLFGGGGNDSLFGGEGNDNLSTLDRSASTANEVFTVNTAAAGGASFTTSDGTSVTGIELLNLSTGSGNDQVTYVLTPVTPNAGQVFSTGDGRDRLALDFSAFDTAVSVFRLNDGSWEASTNGRNFSVRAYGVEDFTITGGSADDNITTGDGDDVLVGNGGGDNLFGGGGNDSLFGGEGNDNLSTASTAAMATTPSRTAARR